MNNSIPIFDCLTHPTIDGNWILPKYPNVSQKNILLSQMEESNVRWAFAVGMKGIGKYNQMEYIKLSNGLSEKVLFPVAYFEPQDFKDIQQIKDELRKIKQLGYIGIKLHPRMSDFTIDGRISNIIKFANNYGLTCLLCTYCYGNNAANRTTPDTMMQMLEQLDGAKVVLLHSGAIRLLEYMEIARAFSNVLLDISFTICKYEGSSIDSDIAFVFKSFDKRIAIGSDFPEFSLKKLRERFDFFSSALPNDKKEHIAYRNVIDFCEIKSN